MLYWKKLINLAMQLFIFRNCSNNSESQAIGYFINKKPFLLASFFKVEGKIGSCIWVLFIFNNKEIVHSPYFQKNGGVSIPPPLLFLLLRLF